MPQGDILRLVRLRDGIESFEKIRLLREAALAKLDAVLADFTWQRGQKPGPHADDVKRVNAAILEATRIIAAPH